MDSHFEKNITTKSCGETKEHQKHRILHLLQIHQGVKCFTSIFHMFITRFIHHKDHTICLFQEVLGQFFHFQLWTFQIPGDEFENTVFQHFGHLATRMGDCCHISKVQILKHRAFTGTNEAKDQDFVRTIPQICEGLVDVDPPKIHTKVMTVMIRLPLTSVPALFFNVFQRYLTCLHTCNQTPPVTHLSLILWCLSFSNPKHRQVVTALVAEEPILDHFSRSPTASGKVEAASRCKPESHQDG